MRSFSFRNQELSLNKELRASLISIYGLSWTKAILVTSKVGISFPFFSCNLNIYYFGLISYLLHYLVISQTRIMRFMQLNIKKLIDTQSYKGARHRLFLPVRGQRTRSNAQTRKKIRFKR